MYEWYDMWLNKRQWADEWKNGWDKQETNRHDSLQSTFTFIACSSFLNPSVCITDGQEHSLLSLHQECYQGSSVKHKPWTCVSDSAWEACYTSCLSPAQHRSGRRSLSFTMCLGPGPPRLGVSLCLFFVNPAHHSLRLRLLEVGVVVVSSSTVCRRQQPPIPLDLRKAISNPARGKGCYSSVPKSILYSDRGCWPHVFRVTSVELALTRFLLAC